MTTILIKRGPGKPSTGLSRNIPLLFMLNADEWEYLSRLEYAHQKLKEKKPTWKIVKKAQIIRNCTFPKYWRGELDIMRARQGANIPNVRSPKIRR